MKIEKKAIVSHTLPCKALVEAVEAFILSYTPLWAHSFFKFNLNGVPGTGLPRRVCIIKPMLNIAVPELFPEQGNVILNS